MYQFMVYHSNLLNLRLESQRLHLLTFWYCSIRERYESALKQLSKGREMLEEVIMRLVELSVWRHRGLVCFTEIESREVLRQLLPDLTEEDLEVYLGVNWCSEYHIFFVVHSYKRGNRRSFSQLGPFSLLGAST